MLQKSADARKKLPPLKPNLALPTWGQKCFKSEAKSFEIPDFDLGHPVTFEVSSNISISTHTTTAELLIECHSQTL